jgi:phosphate transport system permease protein
MKVMEESGAEQIDHTVSAWQRGSNRLFCAICTGFAWLTISLVFIILFTIFFQALPSLKADGVQFLTGSVWDRNKDEFGILPQIWGTLYTSIIALLIGGVFGLAVAIFLTEGFLSKFIFFILEKFNLQHNPSWN